jgi:hypothetical protein
MNPQPPNFVGTIGALFFLALVVFYIVKELRFPSRRTYSNSDILIPLPIVVIENKTQKQESQTKPIVKAVKPVKPVKPVNQNEQDAILALHKFGFKKKEAISIVSEIVKNHNPSSLEEIIKLAFSKK